MPYFSAPWWTRLRALAVGLFVIWHLTMLVISNAELSRHIENWKQSQTEPGFWPNFFDRTAKASLWYEAKTGMDQAWKLFTSPIARRAPFLAVQLIFADGTSELITSTTEPADLRHFWRVGETRLRKFENHLMSSIDYQLEWQLAQRYAKRVAREWREQHADDQRKVTEAVLIKRIFQMPEPGQSWQQDHPVEMEELARLTIGDES